MNTDSLVVTAHMEEAYLQLNDGTGISDFFPYSQITSVKKGNEVFDIVVSDGRIFSIENHKNTHPDYTFTEDVFCRKIGCVTTGENPVFVDLQEDIVILTYWQGAVEYMPYVNIVSIQKFDEKTAYFFCTDGRKFKIENFGNPSEDYTFDLDTFLDKVCEF